jgi:3-isopropylmalate/(R)-2-methylmalate dehydratase small subunit
MDSKISQVTGRGLPLVGNDIDTDRIIPARFLKAVTFDGLGAHAFADDRTQLQGQHPFDLPQYQGAEILVVNANFGCGSSREHAPQSINKWGIKAIVGESFSEIFFGNCVMLGLPCAIAAPDTINHLQQLVKNTPTLAVTVDLVANTVICGEFTAPITMTEGPRQQMIAGTWDACGQLVANAVDIAKVADRLPYLAW